MGAVIEVGGVPKGTNVGNYSVTETASPVAPDDTGQGFGQVSFTTNDWPTSKWMLSQEVGLRDGIRGRMGGVVRGVDGSFGELVSFSADSVLSKFNVVRIAQPMTAMLSEVFDYYLELCEIVTEVDFLVENRRVSVPSFNGNVWDHIKQLCSVYQIDLAAVGDKLVLRERGVNQSYLDRASAFSYSAESMTAARTVQVNYYNHHPILDGEVYPVPTDDDGEPTILQVEAGETVVHEVELSASVVRLNQPVQQYIAGPGDASGTAGRYCVVGADNLPITVAQWQEGGGSVEAEIDPEDPSKILIKVTGAKWPHLAPYRIAASAGGTDYNSLHITGDGVARIKRTALLYTGADPHVVMSDVGVEVDNPYMTSLRQALTTGFHTAAEYNGAQVTISGTVVDPHRPTPSQEPVEVTLRDLDDYHEGVSEWHGVSLHNSHGEYGLEGWEYDDADPNIYADTTTTVPGVVSMAVSDGAGTMSYPLPVQPAGTVARVSFWYWGTGMEVNGEILPTQPSSDPAQYTVDVSGDEALVVTGTVAAIGSLQYEVYNPAGTLADFDNLWELYETVEEFSNFWEGRFLDIYENQLFGNVTGSIITIDGEGKYRIDEATIDTGNVNYTARPFSSLEDLDEVWEGSSQEDFDNIWFGASLSEFSLTPLWYSGTSESN